MDNNGEIRGTWKGYKELWESLGSTNEEKISTQQKISNGIKAFSDYMSHADSAYYYNKTYLPKFTDEFWEFLRYFAEKYPYVEILFTKVGGKRNLTLKIDRYWQVETETDWRQEKISCLENIKRVCSDEMFIECSVLCNMQRYVYSEKINIKNMSREKFEESIGQFLEFLKKYFPDKTGEDEEGKISI